MSSTLFRRTALAVALALPALTAAPLAAQKAKQADAPAPATATAPDFATMGGAEAFRTFREQRDRVFDDSCGFGVPLLGAMERAEPENMSVVRFAMYIQAICADEERRYEDGAALTRRINALDPAAIETSLSFYFARQTADPDWALEILGGLNDDQIGKLDSRDYWQAVRPINLAGRSEAVDALALRWIDDGKLPFFDSEMWAILAGSALGAAAREGRADMADQLLGYITDPLTYIDLLTDRTYAPLWPQIEARAGANLAEVGAENVAITRQRLTNAPSDRDRFSEAAYALHFHGEFEAVIALAQSWREREARGVGIEEGDAWALNLQAYAHDALGQPERADAVFDELATYDPEEHDWVVNFVINRASRLIGYGRWEEGLAAAQLARTVRGSKYAEMIVAKDHTCALAALGRADEAASELDFLREYKIESVELAALGLLCHGLRDEAAALLTEALEDPGTRESAIGALLAPEADLFYTQSILPDARALMAEYPALAAAFAEHARDLPEAFTPRAAQRRVPLDLPVWEVRQSAVFLLRAAALGSWRLFPIVDPACIQQQP